MTDSSFDAFRRYLSQPADASQDADLRAARRAIGLGQPVFAFVAKLVEAGDVPLLERLYRERTRLHRVINDERAFRTDDGFAGRAGAPFRDGEKASVHAVRALGGLGLALAGGLPVAETPTVLCGALDWYADARGSLATQAPWDPAAVNWGRRLAPLMALLADAAGQEDSAGAALTTALTLHELAAQARIAPRGRHGRQAGTTILLLLSRSQGTKADLRMPAVKGLPPGLVPDPRQMALFSADEEFQRSLGTAWFQAGDKRAGETVLWSIRQKEGPSPRINGQSAGAALAVTLDEVQRLGRPLAGLRVMRRLQSSTAIVGQLDDRGRLRGVEGYEGKLAALGPDARVIIPKADEDKARDATLKSTELVFATDWKDAAGKARRPSSKVILRQGLAALVAVACVALGVAAAQHSTAVTASRAAQYAEQTNQADAMATDSANLLPVNTPLAMLVGLQAYKRAPTVQARTAVIEGAQQPLDGLLTDSTNVISVAFSPDRNTLAVGDAGGDITLWNMTTRQKIATLNDPSAVESKYGTYLESVAFSPDGQILADADGGGHISLWNMATRREITTLTGSSQVQSVAFSPGGRILADGDDDGDITLWDMATRRKITTVKDGSTVNTVVFSPDGRTLATSDNGGDTILWNVTTPRTAQQVASLPGSGAVNGVAFSPDGRTLAAGDDDGDITLWNVATRRKTTTLTWNGMVDTVVFSPDGRTLAAGNNDNRGGGNTSLWNVTTRRQIATLNQVVPVYAMAFSLDGRTLAVNFDGSEGDRGFVSLWDMARVQRASFSAGTEAATVAFNPDGRTLATGDSDGDVSLWNMTTGQDIDDLNENGEALSVAFSPNGRTLAVGDDGGNVRLWSVATKRNVATLHQGGKLISSVAFSPDGRTLATGGPNGTFDGVDLWNLATGKLTATLASLTGADEVAFSPNGRTLAGGGRDAVYLWNVATGELTATLRGSAAVEGVAFSPDGHTVAVGDDSGNATLWTVATGRKITILHDGSPVLSVAFNPEGTALATGDGAGDLKFWNAFSGQLLVSLPEAGDDGVSALAFSQYGQFLAAGGKNGKVVVLSPYLANLSLQYFTHFICGEVETNMTPSQWNKYAQGQPYQKTCA